MAGKYEAKDYPLKEILFGHYKKYRIPRYQRPYSWEEDQISDFWDDLLADEDTFLIGALIFNKEHEEADGYIDIIDGQQRLLTVTILCAALRDVCKLFDTNLSEIIQRQDIAIEDREGKYTFRIKVGDTASGFFEKFIQSPGDNGEEIATSIEEEKRLKNCYAFFKKWIEKDIENIQTAEGKINRLKKIRGKYSNIQAIQICINSEDDAYDIFEATNARGLELSVADLLKNLIFQKIRQRDDKDLAKEFWRDIENNIAATDTDLKRFFRYYYISKHAFVPERKLFKEFKKEIGDWEQTLSNLRDASELYKDLLVGSEDDFRDFGKDGSKIFHAVFSLRLMGVSQCYVLLMAILRNFQSLHTNPTRNIQLIEKFTFSYSTICKKQANAVEKIYSKYAIEIEKIANDKQKTEESKSKGIQQVFAELTKRLKEIRPSEESFAAAFREFAYSNSEKGRMLTKYTLQQINEVFRQTDEQKIDFEKVNIEHVLPQKPASEWGLNKEDIKPYVNKLGNLTLLSKKLNSKIQNKTIEGKIEDYRKSELPITKNLVINLENNGNQWGEKLILTRHEEFVKIAKERFLNY